MNELEERINKLLGDPEQLDMITSLAGSLMGGGDAPAKDSEPPATPALFDQLGIDGDTLGRVSRILSSAQAKPGAGQTVLEAMRPFLSEKRRQKVDKALKIAKLAKLAGLAMGEGEGGGND